ncbi:unnamed protein product [Durusdinium trenchii]|uniref:Uncharacterized protein n=1 Tax=Durusdinium trenchii TaxID=1381693 RepID=A0ABP0K7E0_9DINO
MLHLHLALSLRSYYPASSFLQILADWYLRQGKVIVLGDKYYSAQYMNDHPIKGIGNAGAQAVAKMLRENRSVQEIYLHDKRIGEIGGQALLEALRHNSRVLVMNLNENPAISDEVKKGIQGLLEANKEAVRRQKEAFFATLKELQRLSEAKPGMGKSILDRLEGWTVNTTCS